MTIKKKDLFGKILFSLLVLTIVAGGFAAGSFFLQRSETKNEIESWLFGRDEITLPIIMYHSISPDNAENGDYIISAKILEEDLKWLNDNGYKTVSTKELIGFINGEVNLPDKSVMITFDDGMINNFQIALPIMEKYKAKGVYSVVGKYCDGEYGYADWSDIREYNLNPLVEIQNHSYDMHELFPRRGSSKKKGEGISEYVTNLAQDISKMNILLYENSGISANAYTYPFGIISEESFRVIEALGFKISFSCYEKNNVIIEGEPDSLYLLNRFNRAAGISTERFMEKLISE